jgi:hypothetical protein
MSFRLTVFPFSDGLSARCPLLFTGSGQRKNQSLTIRNGKIFQKIIELAKKA